MHFVFCLKKKIENLIVFIETFIKLILRHIIGTIPFKIKNFIIYLFVASFNRIMFSSSPYLLNINYVHFLVLSFSTYELFMRNLVSNCFS